MIEHRTTEQALIEVKTQADRGSVKVRAASFLGIDRGREMILPGAYANHTSRFASKGRAFVDHKHGTATKVGQVYAAYEDTRGLVAIARFAGTELAQQTRQRVIDGELNDVSIGHHVVRDRFVTVEEVKSIWKKYGYTPTAFDLTQISKPGRIRIIEEADPAEFSFVGIPMNDNAEALEVKSMHDIEEKRGAVLNGANAKALKQAYKLIRSIFKSAKIEDIDELEGEAPAPPAPDQKTAEPETPASDPVEKGTPGIEKTDAELTAKRLRIELELMELDDDSDPFRADPASEATITEAREVCPVIQE